METKHVIDQGGPAFPYATTSMLRGMTLRDYFAGQALAGMSAHPDTKLDPEQLVELMRVGPWLIADAMIAARDKPTNE